MLKHSLINYIFLDEIQEIDNFEKIVISLFENKRYRFDLYITGSNSHLFSRELATLFTGRNFPINVYPLSYKEYFKFFYKNGEEHKAFDKYIKYGSLGLIVPIINDQDLMKASLNNVFNDTINKDIKNRNHVRYANGIESVLRFVYKNIGRQISAANLENYLKSNKDPTITSKTIIKYMGWVCESMLLYKVKYYDIKTKNELRTKSKYYAGDVGIYNSVNSFDLSSNYGYVLENTVLLELYRRDYEVYTFDNRYGKNIDFLAIKNNKIEYIQVTDHLNDRNWDREVGNLLSVNDAFQKHVLFLENTATKDQNNGIIFSNLLNWLLQKH